jgi:threonine dehydratase
MFPIAQAHVARSLLVSDAEIRQTQHWLWEHLRIAAEPGGAAAMAALLCARYPSSPGERIGVLMCGANVDPGSIVQPLPA